MLQRTLPRVFEKDEFFPAARVTCLLLYGDLNSKEGEQNGRGFVPLAKALPKLLEVLKNDGDKYPVYLQIVALVGVSRHVELAGTADSRRALAQTMLAWLQKPQREGLSPDGWTGCAASLSRKTWAATTTKRCACSAWRVGWRRW